jgi:hypothetical protein
MFCFERPDGREQKKGARDREKLFYRPSAMGNDFIVGAWVCTMHRQSRFHDGRSGNGMSALGVESTLDADL